MIVHVTNTSTWLDTYTLQRDVGAMLSAGAHHRTCVEVEDARRLSFHRDGDVVLLDVGGADVSVGQLDLKEPTAALHVVQGQVA